MKIGILVCGHLDENLKKDHGNLDFMFTTLLASSGFEFESYSVVDNEFPSRVSDCDGWLVTGSVHGVYEDHIWIPVLEDFIRDAYAKNIPVTGFCFGHQIMAQALGGKVEKFSGGWGIGHTSYRFINDDPSGKDSIAGLLACHQDQIVELPPEASVVASTDFCAYAGLAYKNNALSFQPHPEFSVEFMRDLIELKISRGFDRQTGEAAIANIDGQNDSAKIAAQVISFYRNAQHSAGSVKLAENAA